MGGIAYGLVNKDRYKNNMRTYNIRNEQYDIIKESWILLLNSITSFSTILMNGYQR